jgi:predicted amidophosphoribosyltransferase
MDQRLFCPHCQGAYEPQSNLCATCGGAIPDHAWSLIEDRAAERPAQAPDESNADVLVLAGVGVGDEQ